MKVCLIDYTGHGHPNPARHAQNVLAFTKATRLTMEPGLFDQIALWPQEQIDAEIGYVSTTIPSSWEFVHYTFLINDVTRGFTHQFVRTRTGAYAQQTMRVLNVNGWTFGTGPSIKYDCILRDKYSRAMHEISTVYDDLIACGAKIEDARGVLPTNIHTNIAASFSLRTLAELFRKRASSRTQGEYRDVIEAMKAEVVRVHPWTLQFFETTFDNAAMKLEKNLLASDLPAESKTSLIKLIDQLRMTAS
jgi:flavin-dependent thymidylate synthase